MIERWKTMADFNATYGGGPDALATGRAFRVAARAIKKWAETIGEGLRWWNHQLIKHKPYRVRRKMGYPYDEHHPRPLPAGVIKANRRKR